MIDESPVNPESTDTSKGFLTQIHNVIFNVTGNPFFWLFFVLFMATSPWLAHGISRHIAKNQVIPPPKLGLIPEFTFTSELNQPFGTKQLKGKVWIANFIFTNCPKICPELTKTMLYIRMKVKNLKGIVHLVSFSVDPVHDTPEVLKSFAQSYKYDSNMWTFLTGPTDQLDKVIVESFKAGIDRPNENDPSSLFEIGHGEHFVLVDQNLQIRGFYRKDQESLEKLLFDIALVANYY